jgi:hypothetical protein
MWVLMAVRSTMRVAVGAGSVLMSLMLAILVMLMIVFGFVFGFVRHCWLSRFFLLRLRQAIAEMPVPSRHQQSACKLYSETEKSSGTVAQT